MTPEHFCYWLKGFGDLSVGGQAPTKEQWDTIMERLKSVNLIDVSKPAYSHSLSYPPNVRSAEVVNTERNLNNYRRRASDWPKIDYSKIDAVTLAPRKDSAQ